eukprot:8014332-Alexandrium_andersonii.AAC.1
MQMPPMGSQARAVWDGSTWKILEVVVPPPPQPLPAIPPNLRPIVRAPASSAPAVGLRPPPPPPGPPPPLLVQQLPRTPPAPQHVPGRASVGIASASVLDSPP